MDEREQQVIRRGEFVFSHIAPGDIERESFAIIERELAAAGKEVPLQERPVVYRCIHTTADLSFADTLVFTPGVIDALQEAIRQGATIVTDTRMALSGISRRTLSRYGARALSYMADADVAAEARERGITRAAVCMSRAAELPGPVILAVGNAPTALLAAYDLIGQGFSPAGIIGVPVGFVNVEASKELILTAGVPCIVNRGRRGGSAVAAAICNALLYSMPEGRD